MSQKHFSFEFSAPRTTEDMEKIIKVHDRLAEYKPNFFSITYGAGGSTRDGTKQAVLDLSKRGAAIAPHLSFGTDSAEKIETLLNEYRQAGINRIVALRGDIPSGIGDLKSLIYANELVEFIRQKTGDHFHIEVAAYPEVHPDSTSVESDIHYFKLKVDAGANSAITQYFYNADAYFKFIESCQKHNIDIPVFPGIMPITNFRMLVRFSERCGAEIPRWIYKHLESYEHDPQSLKSFADEVICQLSQRLLEGGAPGLHIYTLNQSLPAIRLCHNLGLTSSPPT